MSNQYTPGPILPLYYVRHPDGSYSVAQPQPTPEQVAQQVGTYPCCDGEHGGSACADPYCYLPRVNERDELVSLLQQWAALDAGSWHAVRHANEKARLLDETRAAIVKATGES